MKVEQIQSNGSLPRSQSAFCLLKMMRPLPGGCRDALTKPISREQLAAEKNGSRYQAIRAEIDGEPTTNLGSRVRISSGAPLTHQRRPRRRVRLQAGFWQPRRVASAPNQKYRKQPHAK